MLEYDEVRLVDSYDFDQFVKSVYGKPYCYQQQDDCRDKGIESFTVPMEEDDYFDNDLEDEPLMGVSFKTWLDKDVNEKFFEDDWENTLFWYRNFYPHFSMIINDLYKKGLIEKGSYIMSID